MSYWHQLLARATGTSYWHFLPSPPRVVPRPLSFPGGCWGTVTWSTQNFSLQLIVLLCGWLCCGAMGSQKSACACQASYQEGKTTTQECCPKHSSGKW